MTKAKNEPTQLESRKFMSTWVHRIVRAWYVAVLIGLALTNHLFFFEMMRGDVFRPDNIFNSFWGFVILPATLTGLIIGFVQKRLIRKYSGWA